RGKASGGTLDHRRDRLWRHERRGAAAEEDRAQRTRPDLVGMAVDLGEERARPAGMVDRAADVAVEVAVRALRPAERPVHVDAKARLCRLYAFARWRVRSLFCHAHRRWSGQAGCPIRGSCAVRGRTDGPDETIMT